MINSNTLAPITGSSIINKQLSPLAENVERKIMVIGTYLNSISTIIDNVPQQIFSEGQAGTLYGFGSMIHRLVLNADLGGNGTQLWVTPQPEAGGSAAAVGGLLYSGASIGAGTHALYIAGIRVAVGISAGDTPAAIATKVIDAINADVDLPVSAVVNGVTPEQVDLTAKSFGPWGNEISIFDNLESDDVTPANLGLVITDMASGAGIPDIQDALDGMGVGDDKNSNFWTGLTHGYGEDTTTLDSIANWNGLGNTLTGLYDKLVHRPVRVMIGSNASGAASLTALLAVGDGRKEDRANGIVSIPGSENHPAELGALALGYAESLNNSDPNLDYEDIIMEGVRPGNIDLNDRFTSEHDNRDIMAKSGISSTLVRNGVVYMQNLLTFYHPDNVSAATNSYRDFEKISRIQNILQNQFNLGNRWKQKTIVAAVEKVTDSEARKNVIDSQVVITDMVVLIKQMIGKGWIRNEEISVASIIVAERVAGNGFDISADYILSGNSKVRDIQGFVDSALTLVTTTT